VLAADAIETREIDTIQVRGKAEPQRVFELLGRKGELDEDTAALRVAYGEALAAYRAGRWEAAREGFTACLALRPDDGPTKLFLARIAQLESREPSGTWDGIWRETASLAH
jgi:adenylate cyclase